MDFHIVTASHEDLETWATVEAGIDGYGQLVVRYTHYHYDQSKSHVSASVDKGDTATLARQLEVDPDGIIDVLIDEYEDAFPFNPSEVETIFQDILEKILDYGVHYRLNDHR